MSGTFGRANSAVYSESCAAPARKYAAVLIESSRRGTAPVGCKAPRYRPMPVLVTRKAPASPELKAQLVKRMAQRMLEELSVEGVELSILLTNDTFIHELNLEHRKKDKPTDVLSFPLMDPDDEQLATLEGGPIGDVVISLDTAQRQAKQRRHPLLEEVRFLLGHGILHLLGYDHETDAEEQEMDALTRRLVLASKSAVPTSKLAKASVSASSAAKTKPRVGKQTAKATASHKVSKTRSKPRGSVRLLHWGA
jgi:probable rRNA maturation factor